LTPPSNNQAMLRPAAFLMWRMLSPSPASRAASICPSDSKIMILRGAERGRCGRIRRRARHGLLRSSGTREKQGRRAAIPDRTSIDAFHDSFIAASSTISVLPQARAHPSPAGTNLQDPAGPSPDKLQVLGKRSSIGRTNVVSGDGHARPSDSSQAFKAWGYSHHVPPKVGARR